MQTQGKAARWLMEQRNAYLTDQRYDYPPHQRTITLTAEELMALLAYSPRLPADKDHQDGHNGRDDHHGQHGTQVVLQISDDAALKKDLGDLEQSIIGAHKGLENVTAYIRGFGADLDGAQKSGKPVDCGKLMEPYRQGAAWSVEAMKKLAMAHYAITRIGTYVGFKHDCPAPACVAPLDPPQTGGGKGKPATGKPLKPAAQNHDAPR